MQINNLKNVISLCFCCAIRQQAKWIYTQIEQKCQKSEDKTKEHIIHNKSDCVSEDAYYSINIWEVGQYWLKERK